MDLARLVRGRRMTRRFRPDTVVPDDIVLDLLDLAGRAPSAGFSQGWEYVVLRAPHERKLFWAAATPPAAAAAGDDWLAGVRAAPVLVLAYADEPAYRARYAEPDKARPGADPSDQDWPVPYWLTDTAMGVMLLLLGAREAGLDALFFGVPGSQHEAVSKALGVPDGLALVGVIALGHEEQRVGGSARTRPRRTVEQFTHWGAFGAPRA